MEIEREMAFISPIRSKIDDLISKEEIPFIARSAVNILIGKIFVKICEIVESLLGVQLFVKVFGDEFDHVDTKLKKLLNLLLIEGIIESFQFKLPIPEWPKVIYASASLNSIQLPSGISQRLSGTTGGGCALDYNTATEKALAEALERYSLSHYDPLNFIQGTFEDVKYKNPLDIRTFENFSEKQLQDPVYYKNHYFNEKTKFGWVLAQSFLDSKERIVPAQLAFLFYETGEGEPTIRQTTTNGAAAGSSWIMAAYNAICENIERDSLMIFWLNRLAPPKIDLSSITDQKTKDVIDQCRRYRINLTVFDITTDLSVPVFLGVVLDDIKGRYAVHVSPRADLDSNAAIFHVIVDSLRVGVSKSVSMDEIDSANKKVPDLRTLDDRRLFWANPERLKDIEFLFQGLTHPVPGNKFVAATYSEKLTELKRIFETRQSEIYLVDVTAQVARESGLTVLMSIIPELYPLYLSEHFKYLGIKRLYDAPVKMGYLTTPRKEEEMNPVPHPML